MKFQNPPAGVKALRLEMMPDERLPNGGPCSVCYEGAPGNFWLSTVRLKADDQSVALTNATESFDETGNTAAMTVDDDAQTDWSIVGGTCKRQSAVFHLAQSLTALNGLQPGIVLHKPI